MCRLRKVGLLVPAPYYVDADSSCLYMEKVAGAPLQQLLQQGSLDEAGGCWQLLLTFMRVAT